MAFATTVKLIRHKLFWVSGVIVGLCILIALFAPYIAPHDPYQGEIIDKLQGSSWTYPLGTDHLGRCILSRILYGTRVSLGGAFLAISITLVVSMAIGTYADYRGGRLDQLLMRICDALLAFPKLILALALIGILSVGLGNLLLAIVFVQWVSYARIIRGMVLSAKERNYVIAARLSGTSHIRIIWKHIWPSILPHVLVLLALDAGKVILIISELSFLGLGVQEPIAEWGMMINERRPYIATIPSIMLYPGLMIFITVMAFNTFSNALRDSFDVKESVQ
ncbi:ABC transporter permease [Paenibacillus sp. L3-i20]|uniref:ABC transporter permease n=1 Tax=Paenibacillus sp. L3-i20 TaxID=2905833 RepID=UPI001EDF3520|nr:ABC transporter permease subunit [Paenibacillus sp. L3-i20]GKU76533.1 nickel ABC transporter permease subunit NikC [Paenibacillus sp. L3-i20]